MKTVNPARKFLLLAALMPAAIALAQNAVEHLRTAPTATATATAISVPYFNQTVDEWGAVVGYAFKKFKNGTRLDLSLNVANLLDQKEMTVAAYYPEGRTVRCTAGLRF